MHQAVVCRELQGIEFITILHKNVGAFKHIGEIKRSFLVNLNYETVIKYCSDTKTLKLKN